MARPVRSKGIFLYVLADFVSAITAWTLFFLFRKLMIEKLPFDALHVRQDPNFFKGIVAVPIFWMTFYFLTNTYLDIYKKSRALELFRSGWQTLFGGVIIFFALLLNDVIGGYKDYYWLFFGFLIIQFFILAAFRGLVLFFAKTQIRNGKVFIPTLLTGTPQNRQKVKEEYARQQVAMPFKITGETNWTPDLQAVNADNYEEVVVALDSYTDPSTEIFITGLLSKDLVVKLLVDEIDILSGKYKTQNIFGNTLIEIETDVLQPWQKVSKRAADMIFSLGGLLFLSPLLLYLVIRVQSSSSGGAFYLQERIGKNGKPFRIIKFRTMLPNAENGIPMLTSDEDDRITSFGKFLRKYRFDELPQLWNVLIGDMSLVGPRPERKFFIEQIVRVAPKYQLLQRIRPGITSLGMVKFGYAHNVQEMIQRMRYDLLYLENMSMLMDIKILAYTVMTVIKGKGK